MAIHVKELVVRANVGLPQSEGTAAMSHGQTESPSSESTIQAAVAEMMRILKSKKNR